MARASRKKPLPKTDLEPPQNTLQLAAFNSLSSKASNVDEVRDALVAAAGTSRGLWYTFLSLSAYLAIAVGSVTHRQLFLQEPVRLPLLNVDLPLVTFFWVAPVLFLIFHAFLLLQLKLLAEKVHRYDQLVRDAVEAGLDGEAERNIRLQLPNFVFVQLLAASQIETKVVRFFLWFPAWATVVAGPIVLILLLQLQFLPYHYAPVTWAHRLALIADFALLWVFWPLITAGAMGIEAYWRRWWKALLFPGVMIAGISCFVATFPGERHDNNWVIQRLIVWGTWDSKIIDDEKTQVFKWLSLYEVLFLGDVNEVTGKRNSLFSNTLVLPDQDFVDDKWLAEIAVRESKTNNAPWQGERTVSLRGRNLRGAVLARADLRRADFTGVGLQDANLEGALLNGASFACAKTGKQRYVHSDPEGCAKLQGAYFFAAKLQGASLSGAQLQGAHLGNAQLQGAFLQFAQLPGAWLFRAWLQGASLRQASLQGASLDNAQLQGASLEHASLQGASLDEAQLQGASLEHASLQGASLDGAQLQGASLKGAVLDAVALESKYLWRASAARVLETTLVINRPMDPISEAELSTLFQISLRGVPDENTRTKIIGRLSRLKPNAASADEDLQDTQYWIRSSKSAPTEENYQKARADVLQKLACDFENAPFVAQGLVRLPASERLASMIETSGPHAAPIARVLLAAAEQKSSDCLGAWGLNAESISTLRDIVKHGG